MPIEQATVWRCDGIGCRNSQTFQSKAAARISGWMETKFNVFCPACIAKFQFQRRADTAGNK